MKRIILTTADTNYFDVLKVFLYSMRAHNGNEYRIRADLLGYSEEQKAVLQRLYPNLEIVDVTPAAVDANSLMTLMWTRPPQMWKALNEDWDQVCSMDCDLIIRGSIDLLWDNVKPRTLKIMDKSKYQKVSINTRFQGGVYVLGNSPIIKEFYKTIIDKIGNRFLFYDGQRALYEVYTEYRKQIHLEHLVYIYNDQRKKGQREESIIWHAKHGRLMCKPFSTEFKRYLEGANDAIG